MRACMCVRACVSVCVYVRACMRACVYALARVHHTCECLCIWTCVTYFCVKWPRLIITFLSHSLYVVQFDLVCEKKTYRAHIYMAYSAGMLIGSPISGFLCDWYIHCIYEHFFIPFFRFFWGEIAQFSSRWYLRARKSPYELHSVSQKFPQRCL